MESSETLLASDFATLPALVKAFAKERPNDPAVADPEGRINWQQLDNLADRIAARLQQDGVGPLGGKGFDKGGQRRKV